MSGKENVRLDSQADLGGGDPGVVGTCAAKVSGCFTLFNLGALLFCAFVFLFMFYWAVFPLRFVDFDSNKIELGKKTVKAGEIMPIRYPFTKYVDTYPIIHTRIIDGTIWQLNTVIGSTGKGRVDRWFYSLAIPKNLPPGKYRLERIFEYNFNPLHNESIKITSDEFEVINDKISNGR